MGGTGSGETPILSRDVASSKTNVSVGLKASAGAFPMLVLKNTSSLRRLERKGVWNQINMVSATNCPD